MLGRLGAVARKELPQLIKLLDHPHDQHRLVVAQAISLIDRGALDELLTDPNYSVAKEEMDQVLQDRESGLSQQLWHLGMFQPRGPAQGFDLDQWQGKVILIDFDGKSLNDYPSKRAVLARYHDTGFEIVGVNFERVQLCPCTRDGWFDCPRRTPAPSDEQVFASFLTEQGLGWPQVCYLRCPQQRLEGNCLVDSEGTVTQWNLQGIDLEKAVAELLGREPRPSQAFRQAVEAEAARFAKSQESWDRSKR